MCLSAVFKLLLEDFKSLMATLKELEELGAALDVYYTGQQSPVCLVCLDYWILLQDGSLF